MSGKRERWVKSQEHERKYVETGKNKVWGTPHSLSYWMKFLHLSSIDGLGVEIGCGPNGIYKFAPNITGVDPIDFSHVCENFKQGVGENLPFEDKSVDFVICCNALDHSLDPQKVMSEMFRISDRVILWTYIHPRIVGRIMGIVDKTHPYRFTTEDIDKFLEPYSSAVTKRRKYTFFDTHMKYVKTPAASLKLVIAHILGVRGLCIHVEIVGDE